MHSKTAFWIWLILFPPLGLVLLWMGRGSSISRKLAGTLGIAVFALAWTFGVLTALVKMDVARVEMDGASVRPIISLGGRHAQYERLEQSRATMRPAPQTAPVVEAPARKEEAPAAVTPPSPVKAPWPAFRGALRDGRYDEMHIRTDWPKKGLPRIWKQPIGLGYGSFAIAGNRAFTIEQRRDREFAVAYDVETGREVWTNSWKGEFRESMGGDGPRSTPTWDEGRLYTLGAQGEFRSIDAASGKTIWNRNILADANTQNLTWGMAASPLVVDDKVVVLPGGSSGKSVAAYDKKTGKVLWTSLDDKAGYASPIVATLAGRRQLVIVTARRVVGLTVEDGKLLWEYPWVTEYDANTAQPLIVGENRVYISSGYGHGAAVFEVSAGGVREIWMNNRMKNKFSSAVLHSGHVYGFDEAIVACIDAATGQLKWKGGRYGYGQLLLAGGHLVVTTEEGDVVLVKASPEHHEEVARFSAIEGKTWNNPAIGGGFLLVRNGNEMACFRIAR